MPISTYDPDVLKLLRDKVTIDCDGTSAEYWEAIQGIIRDILAKEPYLPFYLGIREGELGKYLVPKVFNFNAIGYTQYEKYWIYALRALMAHGVVQLGEISLASLLRKMTEQIEIISNYQSNILSSDKLFSIGLADYDTYRFIDSLVRDRAIQKQKVHESGSITKNLGWQS